MVVVGLTAKFAPLALVPIAVPPVATVYQLMVFPDEVAFKFTLVPEQIVVALVVTAVGAVGAAFTITDTGVRVVEGQEPVNASA